MSFLFGNALAVAVAVAAAAAVAAPSNCLQHNSLLLVHHPSLSFPSYNGNDHIGDGIGGEGISIGDSEGISGDGSKSWQRDIGSGGWRQRALVTVGCCLLFQLSPFGSLLSIDTSFQSLSLVLCFLFGVSCESLPFGSWHAASSGVVACCQQWWPFGSFFSWHVASVIAFIAFWFLFIVALGESLNFGFSQSLHWISHRLSVLCFWLCQLLPFGSLLLVPGVLGQSLPFVSLPFGTFQMAHCEIHCLVIAF